MEGSGSPELEKPAVEFPAVLAEANSMIADFGLVLLCRYFKMVQHERFRDCLRWLEGTSGLWGVSMGPGAGSQNKSDSRAQYFHEGGKGVGGDGESFRQASHTFPKVSLLSTKL